MRKTFLVMSRLIDLFVDILPIDELGFKHVKLQSEGRPPYNPATLLKLYLYGYKHSIRSSRKLEHFLHRKCGIMVAIRRLNALFSDNCLFKKK